MSVPDPDCTACSGTGMAPAPPEPPHPPRRTRCLCVLRRDAIANVERGMTGLSKASVVKSSPLLGMEKTDMWITEGGGFLAHLRHVAIRQPTNWFLRVTSDAELVTAWLSSIALKGGDILDPDAYMVSTKFISIPDLAVPPDLLVIRMGVKEARNQAASEVLAEALNERAHLMRPTWVWDEPDHPLNVGHLFWSDAVARSLAGHQRINGLSSPAPTGQTAAKTDSEKESADYKRTSRKTLRGDGT